MSWFSSGSTGATPGGTVANGGIGQSGITGGQSTPVSPALGATGNAALAQGGMGGQFIADIFANLVQPYADAGTALYQTGKQAVTDPKAALKKTGEFGLDVMKQRLQQRAVAGGQAEAPSSNPGKHSLSIASILSAYTGGAYQPQQKTTYGAQAPTASGPVNRYTNTGTTDFSELFKNYA